MGDGWVGVIFLIGFYQDNARSVENSLIALLNYKICDIAFFISLLLFDHSPGFTSALLLIVGTLAKSALPPFSSWLYRSLEGPTPSSCMFYGGLSIHLGALALIRFKDLWWNFTELRVLVGCLGIFAFIYGFYYGRRRSDLKSSLAFASISQVGVIHLEIALGLWSLAMWHIVGHTILRAWHYLRASSFFMDIFKSTYPQAVKGGFLKKNFFLPKIDALSFDAFSVFVVRMSVLLVIVSSVFSVYHTNEVNLYLVLSVYASVLLTVYLFFKSSIRKSFFLVIWIVSQALYLASVLFLISSVADTIYFVSMLISFVLVVYSFEPALTKWRSKEKSIGIKNGVKFLGLKTQFETRYYLFIIAALFLTSAPLTTEFFLQEYFFERVFKESTVLFVLMAVFQALNTVHVFRLGQKAFLGSASE